MAMITCPNCGNPVSDRAKTCVHCGTVLIPDEKRYCSDCGTELPPDTTVCPTCGCPVEPDKPEAPAAPQQVEVTGVKVSKKIQESNHNCHNYCCCHSHCCRRRFLH